MCPISTLKTTRLYFATATLCALLTGCDSPDSLYESNVSSTGASILFEASLPHGESTLTVASAVFENGQPEPLIGGDLIQISAESGQIYLDNERYQENYYAGQLQLNNANSNIQLEIVHDAQGARAGRWYPTDEVLVDTEGSELVGYTASVTLPDLVEIIAPQPDLIYTSRGDEFTLEWTGSPSDRMSLVSFNICYSSQGDSLGWVKTFDIADTQSYIVSISQLIPDEETIETAGNAQNVLTGLIQGIFEIYFEALTFGLYEAEDVRFDDFNLTYCELDIKLVRKKDGTLGEGVSGGGAIGSTSDSVSMEYRP
ncbi:MAG: hypothetical protein VW258_12030 [Thalassolituus sp.]